MRPLFIFFITILLSLYFQWYSNPLKAKGVPFPEANFKYYSTLYKVDTLIPKKTLLKDSAIQILDTLKPGVTDTVVLDTNAKIRRITRAGNSIMKVDTSLKDIVDYHARDSVPSTVDPTVSEFYGNVVIKYQDFELNAAYVRWDKSKDLLFARGVTDPKSKKYIDRPVFKTKDQGTALADSIYYNMKTSKAKVYNPYSEQEGGYFSHGVTKKQDNNEAHIKDVIFSTCELPEPHFGIHISKGIITEKQIITGPAYFEFEGIPLPAGIPFGFFPKPNRRASGIIFPQFGEDYTRGFFARDFGYYLGLSDYWDATIQGSIFTRGDYEATLASRYLKRYKYNGNITFRYANGRYGGDESPRMQDFNITWTHTQNANAHPGTTFSASVNAGTSSYMRNTAAAGTNDVNSLARNNLSSSISYGKVFANGLMNLTTSLTHRQDINQGTLSLELPNINFNVSSFSPFKGKNSVGDQWYEKINMSYSMQATNSVDGRESEIFKGNALEKFNSSVVHNVPISTNFNVLKYFNFNVGANYNERWYLQTYRQKYYRNALNTADSITRDTVAGFQRAGNYQVSGGFTTKVYSELTLKKGRLAKLRHVMTPSFSFSYAPDYTSLAQGYYLQANYENDSRFMAGQPVMGYGNQVVKYSIFEGSRAGIPGGSKNASINLSLDNTIEGKFRVKDTTGRDSTAVNGYIEKKVPIVQGLNVSASYNFASPFFKLSEFPFSGRTQLSEKFGISFNGNLSPYMLKDSLDRNGTLVSSTRIDQYVWNSGKGFALPRLTNIGFSFQYSFNPDFFKKRNEAVDQVRGNSLNNATAEQMRQLNEISYDPNYFVDFTIPWNLSLSYNFSYARPTNLRANIVNTVNFNGDLNVTPKWKVTYNSGYDFTNNRLTFPNLGIYRDLHCWTMSVNWVPFGTYQSYSVDIRVKAQILQDLKLNKRKNYYTQF